jgi:hypothetical protein
MGSSRQNEQDPRRKSDAGSPTAAEVVIHFNSMTKQLLLPEFADDAAE